jgi:uncharacterized protein (DUF2252 family)
MDIVAATRSYETWLGNAIEIVDADLARKHAGMDEDAFFFLRATYYRWVMLWPEICPKLARAPEILAVGDLHLENFGTWRDAETRLIWGVNDFDETHHAAYANDLVRLATSILVAIAQGSLDIDGKKACACILAGYGRAIRGHHAEPFVLEELHSHLRALAMSENRSSKKFWKKLKSEEADKPPAAAKGLLDEHMPKATHGMLFVRRVAGAGSLGAPRYAALGHCNGGLVAREAKERAPSAFTWVNRCKAEPADYRTIVARAVRAPDPFLHVGDDWLVRRIGPHSESIVLADVAQADGRRRVLTAMGSETANIHRGNRAALTRIPDDLAGRKKSWLFDAASHMAEAIFADWKAWKKRAPSPS